MITNSRGRGRKRRQRGRGRSQCGRQWGGRRGGYIRGGRGRGGGQSRPYNQTVSLTNNFYYYYVITFREQEQCTETSPLTVKIITIIEIKTCRQNV